MRRSLRRGAASIAAAVALATAGATPPAWSQTGAESAPSSQIDAAFLTQAAQQTAAQVLLAQLVARRGATPEVVDLARAIAATGMARGQKLADLAWAHGLVAPTSPDARGRAAILQLTAMPAGPAFEHAWTIQGIALSNATADLYASVAGASRWPDVGAYATQQAAALAAEKAALQQVEILLR